MRKRTSRRKSEPGSGTERTDGIKTVPESQSQRGFNGDKLMMKSWWRKTPERRAGREGGRTGSGATWTYESLGWTDVWVGPSDVQT